MNFDITTEAIVGLCNIIITYIFGVLAKKYNWIESKYIPIQNLLIGVLAGVLAWAIGLNENVVTSVIACLIGAMSAGGIYDAIKTRKED